MRSHGRVAGWGGRCIEDESPTGYTPLSVVDIFVKDHGPVMDVPVQALQGNVCSWRKLTNNSQGRLRSVLHSTQL
jgi:hypothetical protein